jgi:hypothetical protein
MNIVTFMRSMPSFYFAISLFFLHWHFFLLSAVPCHGRCCCPPQKIFQALSLSLHEARHSLMHSDIFYLTPAGQPIAPAVYSFCFLPFCHSYCPQPFLLLLLQEGK